MIIKTIKAEEGRESLLAILYPEFKFHRGLISPFLMDKRLVIFTERSLDLPGKELILVSRSRGDDVLTKEGSVSLLCERIPSITDEQKKSLESLEEGYYWEIFKVSWIMKSLPNVLGGEKSSIFDLFKTLFHEYGEVVTVANKIKVPIPVVVASLITMFIKVLDDDNPLLSTGYRRILMAHRPHITEFRRALSEYMESDKCWMDYYRFLLGCSLQGVR